MSQTSLKLVNGNIITMDDKYPFARSVEIQNGIITDISRRNYENIREKNVIDCQGKTVLPGFIDAHCHFVGFAESLSLPDLSSPKIKSISDIKNVIKKIADRTPKGEWIRTRGYHSYNLKEKRHPTKWDLDEVTIYHPVCLTHRTGYIHVLNSLALKKANITSSSVEPSDAIIDRDPNTGDPNGILYNMGSYLSKIIPSLGDKKIMSAMEKAGKYYISLGITSIVDASRYNDLTRWNLFKKFIQISSARPRIRIVLGLKSFEDGELNKILLEENEYLCAGGVKVILSETTGEIRPSKEELKNIICNIHKKGEQAIIHAIERHVIEYAVEAIEYAIDQYYRSNPRHRIEHCSVCTMDLAKRMYNSGIVICTQPSFIYYSGERYLHTVSKDQLPNLYPFKTLSNSGLVVSASSDCPVVPPDPFKGIYSAVTRKTANGDILIASQEIDILEAFKMYTINAAYANFEENIKGSITPGKIADLIILNHNPIRIKKDNIKDIKVIMVIQGGSIVFRIN